MPQPYDYAVGMFFLPQDTLTRQKAMKTLERIVMKHQATFLGWREVPCHEDILGQKAKDCMPYIMQCFIEKPKTCQQRMDFERVLYVIRREFENLHHRHMLFHYLHQQLSIKGCFLFIS